MEGQGAFVGDVVPPVVQAGQRHAEQQAELGLMVQRPAAELAAGRDHLDGHLGGYLLWRGVWCRMRGPGGGLDGLVDIGGQLGEDAGDDVPDQLLVATEVAVEAGRRHAHLPGDSPQRDRFRPAVDQQPPRRGDDLLDGRRAQPVAPGQPGEPRPALPRRSAGPASTACVTAASWTKSYLRETIRWRQRMARATSRPPVADLSQKASSLDKSERHMRSYHRNQFTSFTLIINRRVSQYGRRDVRGIGTGLVAKASASSWPHAGARGVRRGLGGPASSASFLPGTTSPLRPARVSVKPTRPTTYSAGTTPMSSCCTAAPA